MNGLEMHRDDRILELRDLSLHDHSHTYLHAVTKTYTLPITPNEEFEIPLDGIHGRLHFVDLKSYQPGWSTAVGSTPAYNTIDVTTNKVLTNMVPNGTCGFLTGALYLGDTSSWTLEMRDSSFEHKIEELTGRYIYDVQVPEYFNNTILQKWRGLMRFRVYKNMERGYDGLDRNVTHLRKKNHSKIIGKASTAVMQVDTITKSEGAVAMTAGGMSYVLEIPEDGIKEESDIVTFDATAGTINAAINRMRWFTGNSVAAFLTIGSTAYDPKIYDPTVKPFTSTSATITITYLSFRTNGIKGQNIKIRPYALIGSNNVMDFPTITTVIYGQAGLPIGVTNLTFTLTAHVSREARLTNGNSLIVNPNREIKRLGGPALILAAEANTIDRVGALEEMRTEMTELLKTAATEAAVSREAVAQEKELLKKGRRQTKNRR